MYPDVSDLDSWQLQREIEYAKRKVDEKTNTITVGLLLHLVTEKERRACITM